MEQRDNFFIASGYIFLCVLCLSTVGVFAKVDASVRDYTFN